MMPYEWLVLLGAMISILFAVPYIRGVVKGSVKPNRVTWIMWSVAPLIAAFVEISEGVGWPALPVFISGFIPLLVFTSSFTNQKAYWKLGPFDYACGAFSAMALLLWLVTSNPGIAIIFAIASDFIAGIPTIVKIWAMPGTENAYPFVAGLFNALTGIAAISVWEFSAYAFPIYLAAINGMIIMAFQRSAFVGVSAKNQRMSGFPGYR